MSEIYIVRTHMSSPNAGEIVWTTPNQYIKNLYHKPPIRQKITSIRGEAQRPINRNSFLFYGLRVTDKKQIIEDAIKKADKDLKGVNPSLSAKVVMIRLEEEQLEKGELVQKLCWALIYKAVYEMAVKIVDLKSEFFQERSLKSLNDILDDCHNLNFLGSSEVEKELNNLRELLNKPVKVVKDAMLVQMKQLAKDLDEDIPPRIRAAVKEMEDRP